VFGHDGLAGGSVVVWSTIQSGVIHVSATSGHRGARPVTHVKQLLLLVGIPGGAAVMVVGVLDGVAVMFVGISIDDTGARHAEEALKVSI
jgi:hypothetical protein